MKKIILPTFLFSTAIQFYCLDAQKLPRLRREGNFTRLDVDGKPFIVAGELHNSTSSNFTYLAPIFPSSGSCGL